MKIVTLAVGLALVTLTVGFISTGVIAGTMIYYQGRIDAHKSTKLELLKTIDEFNQELKGEEA